MPRFDLNTYIDVAERIERFWELYPTGRIITELVSDPDIFERVVFRAAVYRTGEEASPAATGYAAEFHSDDRGAGANQTSWHENGETSAIGRALANLGFVKTRDGEPRPSRQEMDKVQRGTYARLLGKSES